MSRPGDRILFVGIGSPHGDDRVGWHVADALSPDSPPGVVVRKATVPMNLLDWLDGIELLAVCDACRGTGLPGTVQQHCWERRADSNDSTVIPALARLRTSGSHAFGLPAVLDLAERLGRLPGRVVVWGIEGESFEPGEELSPRVKDILPTIAAAIRNELSQS